MKSDFNKDKCKNCNEEPIFKRGLCVKCLDELRNIVLN